MRSKGRKVNVLQVPPGETRQHKNHPGQTRKDAAIYTRKAFYESTQPTNSELSRLCGVSKTSRLNPINASKQSRGKKQTPIRSLTHAVLE